MTRMVVVATAKAVAAVGVVMVWMVTAALLLLLLPLLAGTELVRMITKLAEWAELWSAHGGDREAMTKAKWRQP